MHDSLPGYRSAFSRLTGCCFLHAVPTPLLLLAVRFSHQALLNERMAPDILQYKEELVERVKAGLKRQVNVASYCCTPCSMRLCCPLIRSMLVVHCYAEPAINSLWTCL
jgi:hypothetical protein